MSIVDTPLYVWNALIKPKYTQHNQPKVELYLLSIRALFIMIETVASKNMGSMFSTFLNEKVQRDFQSIFIIFGKCQIFLENNENLIHFLHFQTQVEITKSCSKFIDNTVIVHYLCVERIAFHTTLAANALYLENTYWY